MRPSCHPRNFNPLSPHGERRTLPIHLMKRVCISIHSPHTGRDILANHKTNSFIDISIHSPHTGRDQLSAILCLKPASNFNPLSPHGERLVGLGVPNRSNPFQSTLPTRGETPYRQGEILRRQLFQSTLPTRGETHSNNLCSRNLMISIHSPHTGRDLIHR